MKIEEAVSAIEQKFTEEKSAMATETTAKLEEMKTLFSTETEKNGKLGEALEEIKTKMVELEKHAGRFAVEGEARKSFYGMIWEGIESNHEQVKAIGLGDKSARIEFKTGPMLMSDHLTGNAPASLLNTAPPSPRLAWHFRNLLRIYPSSTGVVTYSRATLARNGGAFAQQTEGQAKADNDYPQTQITASLDYIAGVADVSRQMVTDLPYMREFLSVNLTEDFLRKEDAQYIAALLALATSGTTVYLSGSTNSAERIIDMIGQIGASGYEADFILTTPGVWASIMKSRGTYEYGIPGAVSISLSGDVMIAGIPLYKSPLVATGKVFVGDSSKAGIAQVEGFSIRSSDQTADNFKKNLVTFLGEARCDLIVTAVDAFRYFSA